MLTIPIFFALIIGMSVQLIDIADSTTAKTLDFAQDMSDAMDCAILGKDLSLCSPRLMEYDFTPEIKRTLNTLDKFKDDVGVYIDLEQFNETNLTKYLS